MSQLTFTIADGILKVSGGGRTEQFQSTDYKAKTWSNGLHDGVIVFPVDGDSNPYASGTWTCKDHADFALVIEGIGVTPADAAHFVEFFNKAVGTSLGYNTQYPQTIISAHIDPDTSVPTQITTIAKAGYVTISSSADNGGVIYVGGDDVHIDSYHLGVGKDVFMELDDLSKIWVFAATPGDTVDICGAYKY